MRIVRAQHLLLGDRPLVVDDNEPSTFTDVLLRTLTCGRVRIGDVVLLGLDEPAEPTSFSTLIASTDVVLQRAERVWDLYNSGFGRRVLAACDCSTPPHHTQLRSFQLGDAVVSQVAIYPRPLAVAGVRVWCDPALIVIAVAETAFDDLLGRLRIAQPLWERMRAHHGIPLLTGPVPALDRAYPVPNQPEPLTAEGWRELKESIEDLRAEQAIEDLMSTRSSPSGIVERMLVARRALQLHDTRITQVLEHAHGQVADKYWALRERMAVAFPDQDSIRGAHQLSAPHKHLMAGFAETRSDIRSLSARSSDTASLVVTATVGRLLDRSEANKTTGTAVGAALAIIALVSTFTAVASVPAERSEAYLTRLAGWVGFCGLAVGAFVLALAWLANRPALEFTFVRRPVRRGIGALVLIAALGCFAYGATTVSIPFVVAGALAVVAVSLVYAALNDFR